MPTAESRARQRVGGAKQIHLVLATILAIALATALSAGQARAATTVTIWGGSAPSSFTTASDTQAVELGTRFTALTNGRATGVRFYKTPENSGTHVGSLWTADGSLLARVTFTAETWTGWQTASFSTPVSLVAGRSYVVSYHTKVGRYVSTQDHSGTSTSPSYLRVGSGAGVYAYGPSSAFPRNTWRSSQYWVDLTFEPSTVPAPAPTSPTTAPTATTSPRPTASPTSSSCAVGQIGTPPNCVPAPPVSPAAGKTWNLTFNDDFNGSTLNSSKWASCFDWNYGACADSPNQGRERYLASQIQVGGGLGRLVAAPLSPPAPSGGCYQGSCNYKSAVISTARLRADDGSAYRYSFTYGYVESRLQLTSKPGFFSAFWMLPSNAAYSYDTELDIAEVLGGNPNTVFMTYHHNGRSSSFTPNRGNGNNGACAVKDYTRDFVRLGVDWQRDHVAWYIDGVKCGQFNGDTTTIEDGPMHLIMNVMVDNQWQRDWNLASVPGSSDEMQIDYVRVYQQR